MYTLVGNEAEEGHEAQDVLLHNDPVNFKRYPHGFDLLLQAIGVGLALFLPCVEASIVSTSLITITNDLQGSEQSSWVITSYLIGYTGFFMIWSKSGDIFGVKPSFLASLTVFILFSALCGGSQSLNQLIACRALQGVGGSGVSTLSFFTFVRLVPPEKYGTVSTAGATVVSLGWILGPLIGGAITLSQTWRWAFLLNIPLGLIAWMIIYTSLPPNFPNQGMESKEDEETPSIWRTQQTFFQRADLLGAFLIVTATLLVVTALAEAETRYQWSSSLIVSFLTASVILFVAFVGWEWKISWDLGRIEPMFPWRLLKNPFWPGILLGFTLVGTPTAIYAVELPQRFQTVNQFSPLQAGMHLLAYAICQPIGSLSCTLLADAFRIPFLHILFISTMLQIAGTFLLSGLQTTTEFWIGQLGYMSLSGLGIGAFTTALTVMIPLVVEEDDHQIAIGIGLQLRTLGCVLGVAIGNSVLNTHLRSYLPNYLSTPDIDSVIRSVRALANFPPGTQNAVRGVFAEGFNMQMKVGGLFSVAQLVTVFLVLRARSFRLSRDR